MIQGNTRLAHELERAFLALDRGRANSLLRGAELEGATMLELIEGAVLPALARVGCAWEEGSIALSQYYMCGRICEEVVMGLLPSKAEAQGPADAAIVTLEDRHQFGKRIVLTALVSSGFSVVDLGRATVEELVPRVLEQPAEILLVSVLLLRSALRVQDLRQRLHDAGSRVRVVVGGAPFRLDPELWRQVGADAMGRNALDAVSILRAMTGRGP